MKKILFFALALIAFASCSKEDAIENESIEGKEYVVNLGFSGEIEISQSPLSKAGTNDLYGVQVYSKKSSDSEYAPYAYGLFDNTADMEVKLIGGYQYKFVATMVEDGKDRIATDSKGYYETPFWIYKKNENSQLGNIFFYTVEAEMLYLDRGSTHLFNGEDPSVADYERPNTVRYYGELIDFIPAENKIATINMKRVCFGAKFIANGFTEGKITIQIPEAPVMTIIYPDTEVDDIFTFSHDALFNEPWTNDGYQENLEVSIIWTKADGTVVPISNQIIEFTRNELTTVTINLKEDSTNTDIEMEMEDGDIQPGEEIVINNVN